MVCLCRDSFGIWLFNGEVCWSVSIASILFALVCFCWVVTLLSSSSKAAPEKKKKWQSCFPFCTVFMTRYWMPCTRHIVSCYIIISYIDKLYRVILSLSFICRWMEEWIYIWMEGGRSACMLGDHTLLCRLLSSSSENQNLESEMSKNKVYTRGS